MDEVVETKEQAPIGEVIKASQEGSETPAEIVTETPKDTAPVETQVEATAEPVKEEPKVEEFHAPVGEERQVNGLLSTIQALREERRSLRDKLSQYEVPSESVENAQSVTADPRYTELSERVARLAHSDYDDKFKIFAEEAQRNPAVFEMVMNSASPGEAAYQAGKELVLAKKYGHDREKMIEAIKEETRKELEAEIRKSIGEEFANKLNQRNQTPTNISTARSAAGDSSAPWRAPTFGEQLRALNRKKGR